MNFSDYQYERLVWLIDEKKLDSSELAIIDNMITTGMIMKLSSLNGL